MQGSLKLGTFVSLQSFKLWLEDEVMEDCTCFHETNFYFLILCNTVLSCKRDVVSVRIKGDETKEWKLGLDTW